MRTNGMQDFSKVVDLNALGTELYRNYDTSLFRLGNYNFGGKVF
ncbi:hypothetical protein AGMMS49953_09320 [Endomicrobiia bacterium]|nr:hypothetical protein [Candidatus Endomicrobium trichonymphae]GHT25136.1 hypothetical protein AGMMS49953_09320 [Endomicrobiia bacterium]